MLIFESQPHRIAYDTLGDPKRPLIIMVHPLGMDRSVWDSLGQVLSNDFYVVSYDLPGHGQSDRTAVAAPITLYDLSNGVMALAQYLGKPDFHFIGTSIGGLIGLALLTQQSKTSLTSGCHILSATLTNTAAKIGTTDGWQTRANHVRIQGLNHIADQIVQRWFSEVYLAKLPHQLGYWLHRLCLTDDDCYAQLCDVLGQSDLTQNLADLPTHTQQRILLIAGSDDVAMPLSHMQTLANLLPHAHFKTIVCGHVPALEQPNIFLNLLTQHLNIGNTHASAY